MSKHNYSQYSDKKNYTSKADEIVETEESGVVAPDRDVVLAIEEVEAIPEIDIVNETVETVCVPETVTGVVVDCTNLNVRVAPQAIADVACVIGAATEVEINVAKSTDEWFHVCTAAGVEGYCMRKFVKAHL